MWTRFDWIAYSTVFLTASQNSLIAYNRGKGGIQLNGEFRNLIQSSLNDLPKLPSFMERSRKFGSIGWGVTRDNSQNKILQNQSVDSTQNSISASFDLNRSVDWDLFSKRMSLGSNKIICKNRFHIKNIDNDYDSIGNKGFLRLEGNFTSAIDKKLNMEFKPFHNLNMFLQRRYIKEGG